MAISVDCSVCEEELSASGWLLFGPPSVLHELVSKRHLCLRHGALVVRFLTVMRSFVDCDACDGDGVIVSDLNAPSQCERCFGLGVLDRDGEALGWLV